MRWWLTTDAPRVFSVDNAAVKGMDFSALEPDIWMVQWTEGKGEIERQDDDGNNLNGLREPFIDITPYAPFFQQFLRLIKAKALLLPQAKKVQTDLIREIYESKRQLPFHYPVAAGDYWWDATDETLFSSTASGLQNTIAKLNTVIDKLNGLVPGINSVDANLAATANSADSAIISGINAQFGTINAGISAIGNVLVAQVNSAIAEINSSIVTPHNNAIDSVDAYGNALVSYINVSMLGSLGVPGAISINMGLYVAPGQPGPPPGIPGPIAHSTMSWDNPNSATAITSIAPGVFNDVSAITPGAPVSGGPVPWTNITHVPVANASWIPVGATAPVNVTPAEQAAIMSGIAARTTDLNAKKNTKLGQVAALTTIDAVIDYDVTTGW